MEHPYHNINADDDASTLGSKSLSDENNINAGGDASIINNAASHTHSLPRIFDAGLELESLCRAELSGGSDTSVLGFPPLCLPITRLLAGNHCCVDCGDERSDRLTYASIGYGTILCVDCAHRHVTEMEKESIVKSLNDEHWNLRCTLALLEGSNTKMLDYVKHKPRWRPPKGAKDTDSEDVLAFKQIYMSKAAATYRKNLAKKVDDVFHDRVTQMRNEDAAREEERLRNSADLTERDPFRHILDMNNVSAEEIPGFVNASSPTAAETNPGDSGTEGLDIATAAVSGSSPTVAKSRSSSARGSIVSDRRKGRNSTLSTPLMKHESPNIDLIRQRINARRNMNSSINMGMKHTTSMEREDNAAATDNGASGMQQQISPERNAIAAGYMPHSSRRRITNDLVGEVGDPFIQESYYDDPSVSIAGGGGGRVPGGGASYVSLNRKWSHEQYEQDERSLMSYSSRAKAPPLGMYRRNSSNSAYGAPGDHDVGQGDWSQQRRPMYRQPMS